MSSFCLGLKGHVGIPQIILVGEGPFRQREKQKDRGVKAPKVWLESRRLGSSGEQFGIKSQGRQQPFDGPLKLCSIFHAAEAWSDPRLSLRRRLEDDSLGSYFTNSVE